MVSSQFIRPILIGPPIIQQEVSLGQPINGIRTLPGMKERSPFGERLHQARTHARLTQAQLVTAAGIAQGTLGELEWTGDASMAVVRLAVACGVRPEWLAEGTGEMVDRTTWPFPRVAKELIINLDEEQLAFVEGALVNALSMLDEPNPEDLAAFNSGRAATRRVSAKRKAA